MGKFGLYKIPLRGLSNGSHKFDYHLDSQFFKLINNDEETEPKKGNVDVSLEVKKKDSLFELNFVLTGNVVVSCDRCLDDLTIPIDTKNKLIVKFGKEYAEESDEIVVIPEDDGEINIAWFLFEFISLNIPMKHVHPAGECNKQMSSKLNKHRTTLKNDDDDDNGDIELEEDDLPEDTDEGSDSRWDALKNLNFDE